MMLEVGKTYKFSIDAATRFFLFEDGVPCPHGGWVQRSFISEAAVDDLGVDYWAERSASEASATACDATPVLARRCDLPPDRPYVVGPVVWVFSN